MKTINLLASNLNDLIRGKDVKIETSSGRIKIRLDYMDSIRDIDLLLANHKEDGNCLNKCNLEDYNEILIALMEHGFKF